MSGEATWSLRDLSTATLHESGADRILPLAIRPLMPGWRVSGRVFTVEVASGHNIWIHRAIYAADPGDVLVVSTGGGHEYGYWGDVLTRAAREVGLAGLVIDGCVRDSAELVRAGWPIFTRGVCVRGTGKDAGLGGGLARPITIEDHIVRTGDVVVGDRDGVVLIHAGQVDEVAAKAQARDANEEQIMRRLSGGETTLAIYGLQ